MSDDRARASTASVAADARRSLAWEAAVAAGIAVLLLLAWVWPGADHEPVDPRVEKHLARSRALEADGQLDLAAIEAGKALGAGPSSRAAHLQLAEVLRKKRLFAAAREEYHQALLLRDDVVARIGSGLLALEEGRPADAAAEFRRAVEIDPSSAAGHLDLCIAELGAGRARESIPVCEKAVELNPESLDARHDLGYAHRMAGDPARAAAVLEEVVRRDPARAISLFELGAAYRDAGRTAEARAAFERVLRVDPAHTIAKAELEALAGK